MTDSTPATAATVPTPPPPRPDEHLIGVIEKPRAKEPRTVKSEQWYIATDLFDHGGEILDGWGPFPNQEIAIRVRTLVEDLPVNKRANRTFAVDKK